MDEGEFTRFDIAVVAILAAGAVALCWIVVSRALDIPPILR